MCNLESSFQRTRHSRQRGLGLVELLVGMTIGLLVIAAAIGTLAVSRGTSSSISDISQLQQQGSFALRVIGVQLRQTGSVEPGFDGQTRLFAFGAAFPTYDATSTAVNGSDGANSGSDTLSVATMASQGLPNTQRRDCLGRAIAAGAKMQAQFWVDGNELKCNAGGASQALIENVGDFQVMYRVAIGTGTRIMNATDIKTAGLWGSVTAIEVCLDLKGDGPTPDLGSTYLDCNGTSTARDGSLHLVFRNVFGLRTQNG